MLDQALARYVSVEFNELFGYEQAFVARGLAFVESPYFERIDRFHSADLGLLDDRAMGLTSGGRRYVQATGLGELVGVGVTGLKDQTTRAGVPKGD